MIIFSLASAGNLQSELCLAKAGRSRYHKRKSSENEAGSDGMQKRVLGKTGMEVTELCFGALPMGPMQKNLPLEECTAIVAHALRRGINFVDTAQNYKTYAPIRLAMEQTGIRPIIASKSNRKTYAEMEAAVQEALIALDTDYIDIFHLHAAREGEDAFELFSGALACLQDMKHQQKIRAIGISTHHTAVARIAADVDAIDVVFPIINLSGRGIMGGTKDDMLASIAHLHRSGKGIYLMKALAGGSLLQEYDAALRYVRDIEGYAAVAVGMVSTAEVDFNIDYFQGNLSPEAARIDAASKAIRVVQGLCKSCGACITVCPAAAISYNDAGKAWIDPEKCLNCGYCTPGCPEFAIRVM